MDKFTKIPNEMIEVLYEMNLSKAQYKAILYIIRKTLGWNKQADWISISRMAEEVGMPRRTMIRAVQGLEAKGIISVERTVGHTGKITLIPVTKDTHVTKRPRVKMSQGGVTKDTQGGVTKGEQVPVYKMSHTKDIYKDISKDNINTASLSDDYNPWDEELSDEEAAERGFEYL